MIFPVIITQTIFPRLHTTPVSLLIKPSLLALVLCTIPHILLTLVHCMVMNAFKATINEKPLCPEQ